MSKQVGTFMVQDKILEQNKRQYYYAYRINPKKDEQIQYVCLVISKPPFITYLEKEMLKLLQISNRNVILYKEFKETNNNYYLFMNLFNEDTFDKVISEYMNEATAKIYLRQILNGLAALHENGIKGIDLSPSSIFKNNEELKIGSVNLVLNQLSTFEKNEQYQQFDLVKEVLAPEVLSGQTLGTMASDLYSVSILYYYMLFKRYPFQGETKSDLLKSIQKNEINFNSNDEVSEQTISFLKATLKNDPQNRLKWSEVYGHPLLKQLNISQSVAIEDSVLIQQSVNMGQLMTPSMLVVKQFDVINLKNMYVNLEQDKVNVTPTPQDSIFIHQIHQKFDDENYKMIENQLSLNMQLFKEQKAKAFKRQLNYFIEQRNIYSILYQATTYLRLLNENTNDVNQLEFYLMKAVYVFSNQLQSQLKEIILLAQQVNQELFDQFQIFRQHTQAENQIIDSQYLVALKQAQYSYQNQVKKKQQQDKEFEQILAIERSLEPLKFFKIKLDNFFQISQNFVLQQKDPHFMLLIKIQLILSGIMITSYILKQSSDLILDKSVYEYTACLRRYNQNQLKEEIDNKLKALKTHLDSIYNKN